MFVMNYPECIFLHKMTDEFAWKIAKLSFLCLQKTETQLDRVARIYLRTDATQAV